MLYSTFVNHIKNKSRILFLWCLCFVIPGSFLYSNEFSQALPIQVQLICDQTSLQAEVPFWVGIRLQHQEGCHSYWKNPGDAGFATSIDWSLPPNIQAGETEWAVPQKFHLNSVVGLGYKGDVLLLTKMTPTKDFAGENIELKAAIRWLVCSEASCIPGETEAILTLPASPNSQDKNSKDMIAAALGKLPASYQEIRAVRKDGLIVLHLSGVDHLPFPKPTFFPETAELVDLKKEPIVTTPRNSAGEYLIAMAEGAAASDRLKGVLLWHDAGDPASVALKIDLPIHEDEKALIGFVDPQDLKKAVVHADQSHAGLALPAAEFEGGWGLALVFAFVGGMILNLMPCVLPVISFKVLSFVKMSGQSRLLVLKHGVLFTLGVLVSFWALAIAMLVLQIYGKSVGWGFQLQEPVFVVILATGLMIFALSLFGIFEFGTLFASLAGQAQANPRAKKEGLSASFFSGVLATAVATPCTGPFLGSAIGFAVTLPPLHALLVFTCLGLGMAFPYLLLSCYPRLLAFLPKPGNWMVTFKELMGFMMMATVLWLLWVYSAQTSSLALLMVLFAFLLITVGFWVHGRWGTFIYSKSTRFLSGMFTLICLMTGCYILSLSANLPRESIASSAEKGGWETFSAERVAELQKQGVPVFIDFTAKWCLICQTNHLVLSTEKVESKFQELGVVKMIADWTSNDEEITKVLRQYGRNGVPLYLLYGAAKESPTILPQVLTPDIVIEHLNAMEGGIKKLASFKGDSFAEPHF
ncbi:protein-disulfide reductase DsbD domain-containing protein [Parachlamydia sp. AcF125]|uniref:protein-disulfide reductase DsbD family protein n=1 Tax=Parachlamydia sp. AcF125 TaxID=2795736 RepID=UPI001BCA2615|nr:protein-disulfide reductase DsbD domain-containing protein [Parachlamydia sp. AcF125]MBS4167740.1 Thiol:disulfide interchange protein DsbD [Parachlamydia sp. AcF125]